MSPAKIRRLTRATRYICASCGRRSARFQYRGTVRADRYHNLCFRCFRAEVDPQRARLLGRLASSALAAVSTAPATRRA